MEKTHTYRRGKQSVYLPKPAYIHSSASVVGTKEGEGCFKEYYDKISSDDYFGTQSWEDAESTLQKEAVALAIAKGKLKNEDINYIFIIAAILQVITVLWFVMRYRSRIRKKQEEKKNSEK